MELVWNKADYSLELDDLTIVAAPIDYAPFACQVQVEEQDTYLLLGQQTNLNDPGKPAWFLANTLEQEKTYSPGSVVSERHAPHRLQAVIHDIEHEPTCCIETVKLAYHNVMKIVQKRQLSSLAIPLLGTVHGKLSISESILLLKDVLDNIRPITLRKIWLIIPTEFDSKSLNLIVK